MTLSGPLPEIAIIASGTVDTEDRNGVVKGLAEISPPRVYLRQTDHTQPDDAIHALETGGRGDQLALRRLKKQKLFLKDQITRLESELIPDLNA